jgi:hypothetical protein
MLDIYDIIVLEIMLARDASDVLYRFGRLSYAKTSAAKFIFYIGLAGSNNDVSWPSDKNCQARMVVAQPFRSLVGRSSSFSAIYDSGK